MHYDAAITQSSSSSFVYHHMIIVNSVCCSHALVSGPTWKRPASDGGQSVTALRLSNQAINYGIAISLCIVMQ